MELVYEQKIQICPEDLDRYGNMKLSAMLRYVQQASEGHCKLLGCDWDTLAKQDLFWAVLRHRVLIHKMPAPAEQITLQTWPMPATRAAFPRAVQALAPDGTVLFESVSLWVLMNMESRTMAWASRCGVEVPGIIRGCEPECPTALLPCLHQQQAFWTVAEEDLDVNCHVNNTRYLDHTQPLAGEYNRTHTPREMTVCYMAECRLAQQLQLDWSLSQDGVLTVDGCRRRTDVSEKTERVFAVKIIYQ